MADIPGARLMRRPKWIELSVALTALIVSVVSLFIARRQTEVMDRQLAASVWPAIQYSTSNLRGGEPEITLQVENLGIGPARIRSFRVAYAGRPMTGGAELMRACCTRPGSAEPYSYVSSFMRGRIVAAGQEVVFFSVARSRTAPRIFDALEAARADLDVRVCYCSVLEDCWITQSGTREPEPVGSCAREAEQVQYVE